jgi:hypothetical protein
MTAGQGMLDGDGLMCVETFDASVMQDVAKCLGDSVWKRRELRRASRHAAHRRDPRIRSVGPVGDSTRQPIEHGLEREIVNRVHPRRGEHGRR